MDSKTIEGKGLTSRWPCHVPRVGWTHGPATKLIRLVKSKNGNTAG